MPIAIVPNKNYTIPEITQLLGNTRQTVSNWINSGKLPAMKDGKSWIVKGTELIHTLSALDNRNYQNTYNPEPVQLHQPVQPTHRTPVNQWQPPQIVTVDLEPVKESIEEIKDYVLMLQKNTEFLPDAIKSIFNIEGIVEDKNLDDMDKEPTYFDKMAEDSESKERREELEQKEQEIERREANLKAEFDKISRDKKRYEEKLRDYPVLLEALNKTRAMLIKIIGKDKVVEDKYRPVTGYITEELFKRGLRNEAGDGKLE